MQVGLTTPTAMIRDLFEHKSLGKFSSGFTATVNPSAVVMVTMTEANR